MIPYTIKPHLKWIDGQWWIVNYQEWSDSIDESIVAQNFWEILGECSTKETMQNRACGMLGVVG